MEDKLPSNDTTQSVPEYQSSRQQQVLAQVASCVRQLQLSDVPLLPGIMVRARTTVTTYKMARNPLIAMHGALHRYPGSRLHGRAHQPTSCCTCTCCCARLRVCSHRAHSHSAEQLIPADSAVTCNLTGRQQPAGPGIGITTETQVLRATPPTCTPAYSQWHAEDAAGPALCSLPHSQSPGAPRMKGHRLLELGPGMQQVHAWYPTGSLSLLPRLLGAANTVAAATAESESDSSHVVRRHQCRWLTAAAVPRCHTGHAVMEHYVRPHTSRELRPASASEQTSPPPRPQDPQLPSTCYNTRRATVQHVTVQVRLSLYQPPT
jgi:hypothetical protein